MTVFDVLSLICGLALFLYGMDIMGDSLKRSAGNSLKTILGSMTSNPVKGFLLGLGVTAVIQSSSATTVMVVGFVNSGTMTLLQAVGVIMGANVGTAVTSWLTGLSGLGESGAAAASFIKWLKPDSWMPVLALIGICFNMFAKRGKKKDIGAILLGFSVLMVGMSMMSDAVSGLAKDEQFKNILIMFKNPILGVLAGLVLTAIVQSSSASVGILQSLTVTGAITFGAAIPIVMGQNIGTCVTALISSVGANTNGKRAAVVHLYFNIIGVIVYLALFYLFDSFMDFAFVDQTVNMWGIAAIHTVFKILNVALLSPFYKQLARLSELTVPDKKGLHDTTTLLDERLINTPAVAIERAFQVTGMMADVSTDAILKAMDLAKNYDSKLADEIRDLEDKADIYEDALGSYLVKISGLSLDPHESQQITKLLHIIGDYERISDHAVNLVESVEELKDKKVAFSETAQNELAVVYRIISDELKLTLDAFKTGNMKSASKVDPMEEVVDDLMDAIKLNHIRRVQKNECTIELGFVLSDMLVNFERISDHCSNIAGCLIEVNQHGTLEMHKNSAMIRSESDFFNRTYKQYSAEYHL